MIYFYTANLLYRYSGALAKPRGRSPLSRFNGRAYRTNKKKGYPFFV